MFLEKFKQTRDKDALIWQDRIYKYEDLSLLIKESLKFIDKNNVISGTVISLEADFSPNSLAMLFALIERKAIIVPLSSSVLEKSEEFRKISEVEKRIIIDKDDNLSIKETDIKSNHELIKELQNKQKAGLILFSSGSTGKSKAVVHDFDLLIKKYNIKLKQKSSIAFLLFDHIGGIDTIFYSIMSGSCLIVPRDKQPKLVCQSIEKHSAQVLPTSPSFLNLLLISEEYKNYDLSSLEFITYGAELMNESLLKRLNEVFPNIKIKQKYGLSELGVFRTRTESSNSLWIKIDEYNHQYRIRDGILEVKIKSMMLGYLNAKNSFTKDGYFITGDAVEQKGEYIKILGRKSEMINVGGQKVYPIEVENELNQIDNIADCLVRGEKHALMGQIVVAVVKLIKEENLSDLKKRIRIALKDKLESYKIPQKITLCEKNELHNKRFKKVRKEI